MMDTQVCKTIDAALPARHKEFAKAMFIDSRLTQPILKHTIREPAGMDESMALMLKYKDNIGIIIRKERPDLVSLAGAISASPDMLERIAIWSTMYTTP
jgi:hypothetical protein